MTAFPSGTGGRWRRTSDTLWRGVVGRLIILPPGATDPLEVTGPGLALWHLLGEARTENEIAILLSEAYGASRERVRADITPLLTQLAEIGAADRVG